MSDEEVLAMLRRRPCTVEDLAAGLGAHRAAVAKVVDVLTARRRLSIRRQGDATYYQPTR